MYFVYNRCCQAGKDDSMMEKSTKKDTQASGTHPGSECLLPDRSSGDDDAILDQMELMYKATMNIQMSNRKILAQLNHKDREEKENARFMQGLKYSMHQICEKMKKEDENLSKLKKDVSRSYDQMERILGILHTISIKPDNREQNDTQGVSSKNDISNIGGQVSEDNRNYHGDNDNDSGGENDSTVLPNVLSSGEKYLTDPEFETKDVPTQPMDYSVDYLDEQLIDEILSSDSDSESCDEPKENTCKQIHTSLSDRNTNINDTVLSGISSLQRVKELDAHTNDSVSSCPEQNPDSSLNNSKISGTYNTGNACSPSDTSMLYKLPPPQSTRPQCQKDRRLLRDSRSLKRKRTSVTVDNRYKELEKMCSNIPMARTESNKGNRSSHLISSGSSKQNISKKDPAPTARQDETRSFCFPDKPPDEFEQHIDINTWLELAETEISQVQLQSLPKGTGPDTVLCLDISESMKGENFKTMIFVAKTFIQGIASTISMRGITENVAITVFGHETRVIRHLTNDYQKLLSDLDGLTAGGNTPMAAGLLMARACCIGRTHEVIIKHFTVPARIVLLTDGKATYHETLRSDSESSSLDDFRIKDELNIVCKSLREKGRKVFWVPIGKDTTSAFTDLITSSTKGKMIAATQPSEMNRLIQWNETRTFAAAIASKYNHTGALDRSAVQMACAVHGETCNIDDLCDLITECHESDERGKSQSIHVEIDPDMPILGTRVKRGLTWHWGNQDTKGFGTVVSHMKKGWLYVQWDNGTTHCYTYNRHEKDVEVADAPRVLKSDELIATGCLVKRGESWRGGDEDGGPGCFGSVVTVQGNGLVGVRWREGKQGMYRFGYDGHFDIQICQPDEMDKHREPAKRTLTREVLNNPNKSRAEHASKTPSVEEMNRKNVQKHTDCKATWQYMKDQGIWTNYTVEQNDKLEKAFQRNKKGSPIAEVEGEIFQVSFTKMIQTHAKSKQTMKIQRFDLSIS